MGKGSVGEELAEVWFIQHGWVMERHQPPTVVAYIKGKPTIINKKSTGVSDYTGYERYECGCGDVYPIYRSCEVKEVHRSNSMPASRLSKEQRAWMKSRPKGTAFVAVVWMDGNPVCQMYPFVAAGSYKKKPQ